MKLSPHTGFYSGESTGKIPGNVSLIIACFGVPLIFLPKINFISIASQSAGIRIDDIILATISLLLFSAFIYLRRSLISQIEIILIFFLSFGVISYSIVGGSFFYVIRTAEYFIFFYIGINASSYFKLRNIIIAFILLNSVLILLQQTNVIGGFTASNSGSYVSHVEPVGIGSGTWEIGLLLNISWIMLSFGRLCRPWPAIGFGILIMGFHLLIGSRTPSITGLAVILVFIIWNWREKKSYLLLIYPLFALILFSIFMLFQDWFKDTNLFTRMKSLNSTDYTRLINYIWHSTPARSELIEATHAVATRDQFKDSDFSLIIRAVKNVAAFKYYFQSSWFVILIGTGPGRFGTAMDLGIIRILIENGIAGLVTFFVLIWKSLTVTNAAKWPLIFVFTVSMMTLDTYLSYKVMSFIFFIGGMQLGLQNNQGIIKNEEIPHNALL
jgi:hypothetical protein